MPADYCLGPLCFVPLVEPSPGIFGLQQFVPGLALMAVAWTTADARYRFRVMSAAVPVRTVTFAVLAAVGPLTLLTSLWHAQHWLVPRGDLLTPATWQAILGGAFIGTFFLWAWVAFVRPPVFGPSNAKNYHRAFYLSVLRGADLPEVVFELGGSVSRLVRFATDNEERRRRAGRRASSDDQKVSDVEVYANQILLLMADRKVCRTIVSSSPTTAILLFQELSRTKRFGVPVDILSRNLVSEALKNPDSFLFAEAEGYETGLLGFHKPLTQAMFSDFALVEGVGSLLELDWRQARDLDPEQWKAYCRAFLVSFSAYVEGKGHEHSVVIYGALQTLQNATSNLHKLDGKSEEWDGADWEALRVVVRFVEDALKALNRLGRPVDVSLRRRSLGSPLYDIYDALADLLVKLIWDTSAIKSPANLCWSIQRNSLWAEIFGYEDRNGPAAQIVKRKLMAQIYHEINELKAFPNFKGARYLAFCLNVMGLELNQEPAHRDSYPLQRAVLRWTKRNYALLRQRNSEVAAKCLAAGMSFEPEHMRIVKCYPVEGLRRQAHYVCLPIDPAPANTPGF